MVAVKFLALSLLALASAAPSPPQERDDLLPLPEGMWADGDNLCYNGGHVTPDLVDHPNEPCPPKTRDLTPRFGGRLIAASLGSITGAIKGTIQGFTGTQGTGSGVALPNGNLIGANGCVAGPCIGAGGGGVSSGGYCWRPC